jgi:hypothetical protein
VSTSTRRRTVEYRGGDQPWLFGGEERNFNGSAELIIFEDDLEKCTATDLQTALRRWQADWGTEDAADVCIAYGDADTYEEDRTFIHGATFGLHHGVIAMTVSFAFDPRDERNLCEVVCTTLEPLLRRHRMTIVKCKDFRDVVYVTIGFNTRSRTLRQLYDFGEDAQALIGALDGGELTRVTAGDLIRAGHVNALIGQPEGHWLEVKRQHHDLSVDTGKIKLAESVSRFCNSEDGGLVIYGMASKKMPNDVIRRIFPLPRDKGMVSRYRRVLRDHLHPPPVNLRIEAVDMPDNGMLILIDVPPQSEELKPFLVHGAIVDGKAEDEFISIVRRQGDETIPITAPMIHSMLAAGRALLRRAELPRDA